MTNYRQRLVRVKRTTTHVVNEYDYLLLETGQTLRNEPIGYTPTSDGSIKGQFNDKKAFERKLHRPPANLYRDLSIGLALSIAASQMKDQLFDLIIRGLKFLISH